MITIDDIDIFVLSYNREKYIVEAINSLINQTIGRFRIQVLDNGSTDNTKKTIQLLNNPDILFLGSDKNHGALWNFERAQKLASKKYVVLFHDDDLIHPKYLEYVLKVLNRNPEVSIVCSGTKSTDEPDPKTWLDYNYNPIKFNKLSYFTSLVYLGFPLNFATVIYKTEFLKKSKIDFEQYGKVADRPLVYDCVKSGKVVLLAGQYIQYRIHADQDSKNNISGPFYNETLALHKKYKRIIYKDNSFIPKIFFLVNFYRYLSEEHSRFVDKKLLLHEYISMAVREMKITKFELFISKLFYFSKMYIVYKVYRLIKREFGEYS